jgi:16S rRNA (guanine527-N7)-methyltransferase
MSVGATENPMPGLPPDRAPAPLTPEEFRRATGVSRETIARLQAHLDLLQRWQRRINLVGERTLEDPWRRHILDSAQLLPLLPGGRPQVLDVGSGAGYPGLVLAILGVENVTLVDSDKRKCAFLREAARLTGARVAIHSERIESLAGRIPQHNVITARAVAPLPLLLNRIKLFIKPNLVCLFLKGRRVEEELTAIQGAWQFKIERIPSVTNSSGTIVRLTNGKDQT